MKYPQPWNNQHVFPLTDSPFVIDCERVAPMLRFRACKRRERDLVAMVS